MPKAQYQKRMNKGAAGGLVSGGGSVSVGGGGGTIPETVSAQTGNTIDTAGRHTHYVEASSNPGANERLLKTDAQGQVHLQGAEIDQINPTSVIFQEDGIAIIGDSLAIVPDSGYLAAAVSSAATTIDFGKPITPGVFVIIRGVTAARNRAMEFLQVGALVSGTTYNVTRDVTNLNATDPAWPVGMPFAVLGAAGAGRLWMTTKPARYWLSLQGETADAYTNVVGIGDLNGGWGYNSQTYGMALGEYAAGKASLTWDPTNGLRIRRHTDTLFQVDNNGHATIAGWELDPGHLAKNGVILNSAGYLLLGVGSDIIRLDAQHSHWRMWAGAVTGNDAPFGVTKAGAIKATAGTIGGWSLSANSLVGDDMVLGAGGYMHAGDIEGGDVLVIDSSDDTHRLWAGATLKLDAPFAILKDGSIKARAGTIGGWTLDTAKLQKLNANVGIVLDSATPKIQVGNTAGVHVVINGAAGTVGTSDYTPGQRGWQVRQAGDAEFNNVSIRGELHAAVMVYGEQHATAGTLVVAKSAGKLKEDVTTLARPELFYVRIEDPDMGPVQLFELYDRLRIKDGSGNDNWLEVRGITRSADHWRYNCWLVSGTPATFRAGAAVVDYGQAGDGYLVLSADAEDAPYYDVQTHSGSPWSDAKIRVRLGNLNGIVDTSLSPEGYGLYADNVYLRGNIVSSGGAVKINQWGIEVNADSGGDSITWTTNGSPLGRVTTVGGFRMIGFVGQATVLARSGGARPALTLTGDGAGVDALGWAELYESEGLYASEFAGLVIGATGQPNAMLDVYGDLLLREGGFFAGPATAYAHVASADYTDNEDKHVFSLTLAAKGMWCGEITLSTHRTASGNYGALSRYWVWAYRDADGVVRQNVIRKLDDYTVAGQASAESLTGAWTGDTLQYTFRRDHTATPATALTVMVQGYGYGVSDMLVKIFDAEGEEDPPGPPDPPDPPPPPPANLVPGHYWMLDAGAVDRELATALFYWSELEPTAGNYNWSIVDSWLAGHPNGVIQVFAHTSGMTGDINFQLWLPSGVPYYTITNSGKTAYIPAYDNATFRSRYISFINAFGARYDGQPVIANLGLDGESQAAKTQSGVDWITACYGTDANAVPYRFRTTYLDAILEAYRDAFPNSTVLVNCAPGGTDTRKRVLPLAIDLGLGLKHSGVIDDTDSWLGYDTSGNPPTLEGVLNGTYTGLLGLWDIIRMGYEAGLTIVTESAYGMCPDPMKAVYAALSYHPVAMTWHKEWFNSLLTESQFDWAELYLARTKSTTPGVWWAHHQSVYPKIAVGSSGYYSGHGHCEFWLTQTSDTTWAVDAGVTMSNVRVTVQYTGTGTMTINGQNYSLGASGSAYADITSAVTQVKVTGASVRFIEIRKLSY